MKVSENYGKEIAIAKNIFFINELFVHRYSSRFWMVQSGQQLEKSRFSASISTHNKKQFAARNHHVNRADGESCVSGFLFIAEKDIPQFDLLEFSQRLSQLRGRS